MSRPISLMRPMPIEIVTPLGASSALVGVALLTAVAADQPGYRFGIKNKAGDVPLFGDYRFLLFFAALAYDYFAPRRWYGHKPMRIAAAASLFSLVATESIRAVESQSLWGLDLSKLPSLDEVPVLGRLLSGSASDEPSAPAADEQMEPIAA